MKSYNWRDICGFAAVQVVSPADSLQYFTFPRMGAVCVIPPVFRLQPWSPRAASTWRRASMNPLLFPAGPVFLGSASQQRSFRASVPASGQASSAGSSNHTTTCTQQDKQCRPSSDPLVAFHVVGSRWTGQSQKQQNIKYVFISAMKMTMKRQPLRKSQSDCLLFGVEGFVLCNLWQEGEGRRKKKKRQRVASAAICDSLKSDWFWFADSCCLLAVVGLPRFNFYASLFLQSKYK